MDGMNDVEKGWWSSWNVSSSVGPLGEVCEVGLHQDYPCYASCANNYDCAHVDATCDWTSCHDDVAYTETGTSYFYNADNTALFIEMKLSYWFKRE